MLLFSSRGDELKPLFTLLCQKIVHFTPRGFAFSLGLSFGVALPKVKQVHSVLAGAKAYKQL